MNVVLVNSNPATIMTDTRVLADEIYLEPLTVDHASAASSKRSGPTACWRAWAGRRA